MNTKNKLPRSVTRTTLPVLPVERAYCGVTVYKGVLVIWDEDYDVRVLDLVDQIVDKEPYQNLLSVREWDGFVVFVWLHFCPDDYAREFAVGDDYWTTNESIILGGNR